MVAGPPQVTSTTTGTMIGTAPQQVYSSPVPVTNAPYLMRYLRAWNVAPAGGGTIWLTRALNVSLNVAPNTPGCFPLAPGEYEVFQFPQAIPLNPLWAVATAADTPLTVEVG